MKRKKKCFTETRGEGEKSDVGEAAGGRSVLLPFTNVFISSFFTLMWLTVVLCSAAGSSTPSSSSSSSSSSLSSSSKGFEPAGAVLLGTVKLTTWGGRGTVRNGLFTCTHYIHRYTLRHLQGGKKCFTIHTFQRRWNSRSCVFVACC